MAWTVLFYETANGRSHVKKFLKRLSEKARGKCSGYIEMLEEHGLNLPSSYLEKVRGNIRALRPEFGGNEYRLFFFKATNERFIMTHAILKKTPKIPLDDIDTAENRMNDWLQRESEGAK